MIHFIVGTRAQLFKLAPVMLECRRRGLQWRWVYTAQHRETIAESVAMFDLPPADYVSVPWSSEAKSVGRMARWFLHMAVQLPRAHRALGGQVGPSSLVVTHGDTFTTWLGALLGRLSGTKVLHVESGLRSFHLLEPFPEELNRLLTFRLANFYACPSPEAVRNVSRYRGEPFLTSGNTQIDTLRFGLAHLTEQDLDVPAERYVVATIHRYENVYDRQRFGEILELLERASVDRLVLFVRHPVTDGRLRRYKLLERLEGNPRIRLLPRLPYLRFLRLAVGADYVISDGGGNQEELSYLGVPTLLMRDATERSEGLGGNVVLAQRDPSVISAFLEAPDVYRRERSLPAASPSSEIAEFIAARGFGG